MKFFNPITVRVKPIVPEFFKLTIENFILNPALKRVKIAEKMI